MLARLFTFATIGLHSELVTVEVDCSKNISDLRIVGLGDTAVQESKERIRSALRNSGFRFPSARRITVNLAPADIKKIGPRYDLPMAMGVLLAGEVIDLDPAEFSDTVFLGELALDGSLRHVSGVLPVAMAARAKGMKRIIVPAKNGAEAALVPGLKVIAPKTLTELVLILCGISPAPTVLPPEPVSEHESSIIDFADVHGQEHAKRALEIAAAGGHNVLLSGAPGAGKTLLAKALPGILPPLSREEALEVTQIYSIADLLPREMPLIKKRPFRAVHHTASGVSIVGGGTTPGPGEISLAHHGVLFLDEIAEFPVHVLEVLRQPLEDRQITITRASGTVTFPASFILVAAMNPPEFSPGPPSRIKKRISAPLLDRIDLTIDVQPVAVEDLQKRDESSEKSHVILERVVGAREAQRKRSAPFVKATGAGKGICYTNAQMGVRAVEDLCPLDSESEKLLCQAVTKMGLSVRSYHRTIKVARTIADLEGADDIKLPHVAEALQYRQTVVTS